jgi:hypothetical protein
MRFLRAGTEAAGRREPGGGVSCVNSRSFINS